MTVDDKRPAQAAPVFLRVKLRYKSVQEFVEQFADRISLRGMFLISRAPKEPGTRIRFDLCLEDGSSVVAGHGVVRYVRACDSPLQRLDGMGIEFTDLGGESRQVLGRVDRERQRRGLGRDVIPYGPDHPSARRQLRPEAAAAPEAAAPGFPRASARPTTSDIDVVLRQSDPNLDAVVARAREIVEAEKSSGLVLHSLVGSAPSAAASEPRTPSPAPGADSGALFFGSQAGTAVAGGRSAADSVAGQMNLPTPHEASLSEPEHNQLGAGALDADALVSAGFEELTAPHAHAPSWQNDLDGAHDDDTGHPGRSARAGLPRAVSELDEIDAALSALEVDEDTDVEREIPFVAATEGAPAPTPGEAAGGMIGTRAIPSGPPSDAAPGDDYVTHQRFPDYAAGSDYADFELTSDDPHGLAPQEAAAEEITLAPLGPEDETFDLAQQGEIADSPEREATPAEATAEQKKISLLRRIFGGKSRETNGS